MPTSLLQQAHFCTILSSHDHEGLNDQAFPFWHESFCVRLDCYMNKLELMLDSSEDLWLNQKQYRFQARRCNVEIFLHIKHIKIIPHRDPEQSNRAKHTKGRQSENRYRMTLTSEPSLDTSIQIRSTEAKHLTSSSKTNHHLVFPLPKSPRGLLHRTDTPQKMCSLTMSLRRASNQGVLQYDLVTSQPGLDRNLRSTAIMKTILGVDQIKLRVSEQVVLLSLAIFQGNLVPIYLLQAQSLPGFYKNMTSRARDEILSPLTHTRMTSQHR